MKPQYAVYTYSIFLSIFWASYLFKHLTKQYCGKDVIIHSKTSWLLYNNTSLNKLIQTTYNVITYMRFFCTFWVDMLILYWSTWPTEYKGEMVDNANNNFTIVHINLWFYTKTPAIPTSRHNSSKPYFVERCIKANGSLLYQR